MGSFTPTQRPLYDDFLPSCYLTHDCAEEGHPARTLFQVFCVAQWATTHWAIFYEDDKKGNVVISGHIIDVITGIELQVVIVIFLKIQVFLTAEYLRWI